MRDGFVYMRTTRGPQRVDVIYRRIDDDFLDPLVFRPDSALGVPGLMSAYRAGRVTVANAIGTGIADDKSIYPYVPDMVRFYLGEEPLLANVPTRVLRRPDDLAYTLAHLDELVVKEVHGAGGYGMLVGPTASEAEREDFRLRILAAPEKYIAQPTLALSTCPTFVEQGVAPRHIDLRPFVLSGKDITIVPGRPHARGAARGLAGGELVAGRRHQGHLGAGGLTRAEPHRRPRLLAGTLRRARREPRAHARRAVPPLAAAARSQPREGVGWAHTLSTLGLADAYADALRRRLSSRTGSSTSSRSTATTRRAS